MNTRNHLIVTLDYHSQTQQPDLTAKRDFYKIYSPKKFKLRPREDIYLDLKIKIDVPKILEPWINLLPLLKGLGLKIENEDWASNKTKDGTIQLYLLNRSFKRTIEIRKKQVIAFLFLLGQKSADVIKTKYNTFAKKNYCSISQSSSFFIYGL